MGMPSGGTIKAFLAGIALSTLLAAALFMPVTISSEVLQHVPPVARHYCPDSGLLAEQYFHPSSGSRSADDYVICLDEAGKRVPDLAAYNHLIREVWLAWTIALFPLAFLIFRARFGAHATRRPFRRRMR